MTAPRSALRVLLVALAALLLGTWTATTASAAPSSQDRTWMVVAHQSNLTEIAAGKAAQAKSTNAAIRDLGAMFIADHTKLDADLTAAAKSFGITLPGAPSAAQQATLASVGAKSGAAFNSAWLTSQIAGHRATAAATATELASGSDATTLKLARTANPVVAHHLAELLSLAGTPSSVNAGSGGQAAEAPGASLWALGLGLVGAALVGTGAVVGLRRRAA